MTKGASLVLVIDDDEDTRSCVTTVLEEEGYGVANARNGKEALELLSTLRRPDLVLLDLMMPVMSGWDVLAELTRNPTYGGLPVVVFTAAGENGTSGIGRDGFDRPVLRKPIDLDLLLEMVGRICQAGWSLEEPPSDLMPKPR